MISINSKLRISVFVLLLTIFFSYWVYWKNIVVLHDNSFKALEGADYIHTTENFHSFLHAMVVDASNFVNSNGDKLFYENYKSNLTVMQNSFQKLKSGAVGLSNNEQAKDLIETIEVKMTSFNMSLSSIFEDGKPATWPDLLKQAKEQFDDIFNNYYLPLHKMHQMHNSLLKENTHKIWKRMSIIFFIQIALVIVIGGMVVMYIDRFILKVYSMTEQMTIRDPLTGLYNRRHMKETLSNELLRAQRHKASFSIAMADLDDFKKFNDTFGHQNGDKLLKQVAKIFSLETRKSDKVFRYGGEEFLVFLPEVTAESAVRYAEKIRACIENYSFSLRGNLPSQKATVSIGVASFPHDGVGIDEIISCADKRLYAAKSGGKNCVQT